MKNYFLLFLCFINFTIAYSQAKIEVNIVAADSQKGLPFATIYLKNTGIGTSTDASGKAYLQVKNKELLKDTLICSYIGYHKKMIPVSLNQNISLQLKLTSSSTALEEAVVVYKKPLSVKKILRNVIKNTKDNYSNTSVNMEGLYRETMEVNDRYVGLNEAVLDLHYTSYPQSSIDKNAYEKWIEDDTYAFEYQASMFYGFPNQFNTIDDKVELIAARSTETASRYGAIPPADCGPLALTAKDYVKYRQEFLNPNMSSKYVYETKDSETIKGKNCYVIQFYPKESNKRFVFDYTKKNKSSIYVGNLYIDKKSFAVVKVAFQMAQNFDFGFHQGHIILDYKVTLDYDEVASQKWFLEKITLEQIRKTRDLETKKSLLLKVTQELHLAKPKGKVAHEILPENEWKHTRLTQLRTYEIPYDSAFWVEYETTKLYPNITENVITDLEKDKSLDEQFKNRFKQKENLLQPIAPKEQTVLKYPTETLEDDYQWFADEDKSEKFYAYIDEENKYADNFMVPHRNYQRSFFRDLNNFYVEDTTEHKYNFKNGIYNWEKDSLGNNILCEYQDSVSKKIIFEIDDFKLKRKNSFVISETKTTRSHLGIVYTTDGGLNNHLVYFKKGNNTAMDSIADVYSFEWFNDSLLLYTKENEAKRSDKLFCRNIYSQTDSLLRFEADLTFDISIAKTKSYLACTIQSQSENEIHITPKTLTYPTFKPFLKRVNNVYSTLKEYNDSLYILTNKDALNNKVLLFENDTFTEVVKHHKKTYIQDFVIAENYEIVKTYVKSFVEVKYRKKGEKKWSKIDFKQDIFEVDLIPMKNDKLALIFSSPKTPSGIYTYDFKTEKLTKGKFTELSQFFNHVRRYLQAERIWAKGYDCVKIPMTVLKSRHKKKEHRGLILKAYGMYGDFFGSGSFNMDDFLLLREGYTIVYAHVRGGGIMGRQWHMDGKLLTKENTFEDYISCAEYLIDKKYTEPSYLIGYGNSAGGLLLGVVINRRPELFNTVILDHAYLDVLTTMMMDTLPLTTDHYKEVGNPNDSTTYAYMKNYSPYHNIKKQAYPNLLFTAGSNDFQTPAWQIAKYVAKLRANNTGSNEIIFKTEIGSGHMGSTFGKQWMKDLSFKSAFMYANLFRR